MALAAISRILKMNMVGLSPGWLQSLGTILDCPLPLMAPWVLPVSCAYNNGSVRDGLCFQFFLGVMWAREFSWGSVGFKFADGGIH